MRGLVRTACFVLATGAAAGSAAVVYTRAAPAPREQRPPAGRPPLSAPAPSPPRVAVAETLDEGFVGVLVPPQAVNVASREDAKIVKIRVRVGDVVHEGDLLAQLDDRIKKHELSIARAALRAAQAQSSSADVDLDSAREKKARRAATVNVGDDSVAVVSGEELANARFDEQSARSKRASARASIRLAAERVSQLQTEIDQLVLRAPFDGVVGARYADTGAFLRAGEPVLRLLGTGGLRVRFAVAEEDVPRLSSRRHIEARVDGATVRGTIEQVAPEVEPSSRTVVCEASVDAAASECAGDCGRLTGRTLRVRVIE